MPIDNSLTCSPDEDKSTAKWRDKELYSTASLRRN